MITLKVYDMPERETDVLVEEFRQAGVHEIRWDGGRSGAGPPIYFIRLAASEYRGTVKVLLVK